MANQRAALGADAIHSYLVVDGAKRIAAALLAKLVELDAVIIETNENDPSLVLANVKKVL